MWRTAAALAALAAILAVPAALADGDPASDVLVAQDVFLPYSPPSDAAASALRAQVAAVYAHGQRVKVAVVADPSDLGSVPSLFGQPAQYAKFLGTELHYVYVGPLLVVMAAGFGIYDGGRPTPAADAVLARESTPGSSPDELTQAATKTVAGLLAADALHSRDILPPEVFVIAGSGFAGTAIPLHYRLQDDSGRASALLQLRRGSRVITTLNEPMGPATNFLELRTAVWHAPASLTPGNVRFCVTASDPTGNRGRDCKAIQILKP